jgi:hypothetical protein
MDDQTVRATQKKGTEGQYVSLNVPQDDGSVTTYLVPTVVTEGEWKTYPAAVRQYVRDAGLHDVKTDDEARPKPRARPAGSSAKPAEPGADAAPAAGSDEA